MSKKPKPATRVGRTEGYAFPPPGRNWTFRFVRRIKDTTGLVPVVILDAAEEKALRRRVRELEREGLLLRAAMRKITQAQSGLRAIAIAERALNPTKGRRR